MKQSGTFVAVVALLLVFFSGMWTTIFAIIIVENYDSPYLFAFIFGGTGLVLGLVVATRFKTVFARARLKRDSFWLFKMCIAVGFFGFMFWAVALMNNRLATMADCGRYLLANKYQTEGGFRTPKINYVFVEIDGRTERLICNSYYWDSATVGQTVGICRFKSLIGFDYLSLRGE